MFTGELFKIQKEAANFLINRKRVILGYEQGCGKTVVSLASAEKLAELGWIEKVLIICPSSITWQWEDKINEFTTSNCQVVTAKDKQSRRYAFDEGVLYCITSYPLFRKDFENIVSKKWDLIIYDEAQEFKNNKSKTAKLIKNLNNTLDPTYRWALTGTAISNKLEELYSIFYCIDRFFLPPWPQFEKSHIVRSEYTNQIVSYRNLDVLSKHVEKRLHRKTHKDLGTSLPKLVEQNIYVSKTKEYIKKEKKLKEALDEYVQNLEDLRFTNNDIFGVPHDSRVARAFHDTRGVVAFNCKYGDCSNLITTLLEENGENHIVVFSFFKEPLYELHKKFSEDSVLFTGDQDSDEKQRAIREFKGRRRVLLSSDAGATGLDLPFANYIIHLDIPFSYGLLDQRNKRITRIGSKFKRATAIHLLIKDSPEEYFFKNTFQKKKLAEAVYDDREDKTVTVKAQSLRQFLDKAR